MKNLKWFMLLGVFALSITNANARNIWRECGIGGMLFTKTGWAAITSNIIWDLGTTATSSHVSSEDMCEGPTATAARFVNETYAQIEEETAKGAGQHLSAMLNILGCEESAHSSIATSIRKNVAHKAGSLNAENYFNTVVESVNKSHSNQCGVI